MLHVINNKPQNRTSKRIPLVTTYHPLLHSLGKVLSKNLNFLYMNEEVPKVSYPVPIKTDTFTSSVTKKSYKITRKFVSSGKCLTYLLTLQKCLIQHVVKIVEQFRYRWNSYKNNCRKYSCNQPCQQRHLFEHQSSVVLFKFLELVSRTLTGKSDPSDSLKRKGYCKRTLCSMAPYGLSLEDHV